MSYKNGSKKYDLNAVPALNWLGIHYKHLQDLSKLIPCTKNDRQCLLSALNSSDKFPKRWLIEIQRMMFWGLKFELEAIENDEFIEWIANEICNQRAL